MSNVYYMEEYRLKRDIVQVEEALVAARTMASRGIPVPPTTFERLENMRDILEHKLIAFIEKEEE